MDGWMDGSIPASNSRIEYISAAMLDKGQVLESYKCHTINFYIATRIYSVEFDGMLHLSVG